jgi:hypothetical protein
MTSKKPYLKINHTHLPGGLKDAQDCSITGGTGERKYKFLILV